MRMVIILDSDVKETILRIAEHEMRDPRQQAGLLLREALERRGLLPASDDRDADGRQVEEMQQCNNSHSRFCETQDVYTVKFWNFSTDTDEYLYVLAETFIEATEIARDYLEIRPDSIFDENHHYMLEGVVKLHSVISRLANRSQKE